MRPADVSALTGFSWERNKSNKSNLIQFTSVRCQMHSVIMSLCLLDVISFEFDYISIIQRAVKIDTGSVFPSPVSMYVVKNIKPIQI